MKEFRKTLIILIILFVTITICIVTGALVYNGLRSNATPTEEVVSRTILEKVQNQNFVVTRTVIVDQKATIEVDQGSGWSNFWWGDSITAEALIRLDVGVDFSKLDSSNIEVDNVNKVVKITIPEAEILDASQYGDIEVTSSKGVLKFFLDNDPNEDHNKALQQLIDEATTATVQDEKLISEATSESSALLGLIVENLGYELEVTIVKL